MITLFYSPIAGCPGIANPDAAPYDKRWLILDELGVWLQNHDAGLLDQISLELRLGYLVLRAPGMLRLDIPLDVIEDDDSVCLQTVIGKQNIKVVDEGDLVAAWVTQFFQQPCRLVKIHPDSGPVLWPDL